MNTLIRKPSLIRGQLEIIRKIGKRTFQARPNEDYIDQQQALAIVV